MVFQNIIHKIVRIHTIIFKTINHFIVIILLYSFTFLTDEKSMSYSKNRLIIDIFNRSNTDCITSNEGFSPDCNKYSISSLL